MLATGKVEKPQIASLLRDLHSMSQGVVSRESRVMLVLQLIRYHRTCISEMEDSVVAIAH